MLHLPFNQIIESPPLVLRAAALTLLGFSLEAPSRLFEPFTKLPWELLRFLFALGTQLLAFFQENSGETCKSRPSKLVSPRRDEQGLTQALFYARGRPRDPLSIFERASVSPKREGSRLSKIPCWFLDVLRALV
ncbi:hypothetical protein DEO72_LG2g3592 [Vigna unguiculata]|uniref:Uncharacterized protein n=1 Tax=Vigna unguiculata TaxID=3917 RepID=A0A4D6L420_VIGUN|nr:hypothetical protein DEO72_LG2g3592 [Vigna unguiculata]